MQCSAQYMLIVDASQGRGGRDPDKNSWFTPPSSAATTPHYPCAKGFADTLRRRAVHTLLHPVAATAAALCVEKAKTSSATPTATCINSATQVRCEVTGGVMKSLRIRVGYWQSLVVAASVLFALAGTAHAVTSGWRFWGDVITPEGCRGMFLWSEFRVDVIYEGTGLPKNVGWTQARFCSTGGAPLSLEAGWIGNAVDAYRNGGFCGTSGWVYSTTRTDATKSQFLNCSNPRGTQSFHTVTGGKLWNGNGYTQFGGQASPVENW
jgi:hypothetical protein